MHARVHAHPLTEQTTHAHAQLYLKESDETIENKLHKKIKAEREAVEQRKKNKEAAAAAAAEQEAIRAAMPQIPMFGLGMTANHPALVRPPGVQTMPAPMVPGMPGMPMGNGIMGLPQNPMFTEPLDHFPARGEYCELAVLCLSHFGVFRGCNLVLS